MDLYGAIADPTRRRILEALQDGPHTVSELVAATGYHQPGISRHLQTLRHAGLVQSHPDGQHRVYSLLLAPFVDLRAWADAHVQAFSGRLDRLHHLFDPDAPR